MERNGGLVATDVVRDSDMSTPGTSACLPDIADLCQIIDNHIQQLGEMKKIALTNEQQLMSKIASLEDENRRCYETIDRLEEENRCLKENGEAKPSCTQQVPVEDWKVKYEEMKDVNEHLQREMALQREQSSIRSNSTCSTEAGSGTLSTQSSMEENHQVDMDHKLYLSKKIAANDFRYVLRHLSVPEIDVQNIYDANPHDPKECCIQGLKEWKSNKGSKATVWALVQGLVKSGFRNVAEEFCQDHEFYHIHRKIIDQNDYAPTSPEISSVLPSEEVMADGGGGDATDHPSPPAIPSDATPFHCAVWSYLRTPRRLEDLDESLQDCELFTEQQLQKIIKSKILFNGDSQREEFITACTGGVVTTVLDEWAKRHAAAPPMQNTELAPLRNLGKMLVKLDRKDIHKVLILYLRSGVIGPCMDEKTYIRKLSHRNMTRIGSEISKPQTNGLPDWKIFASDLGFSEQISQLERTACPGTEVLKAWKTGNEATVGELYKWMMRENRFDVVHVLEQDTSESHF